MCLTRYNAVNRDETRILKRADWVNWTHHQSLVAYGRGIRVEMRQNGEEKGSRSQTRKL